jgi:hydroxymethylpyrimidine/phosphomethylpyrimidine kinase
MGMLRIITKLAKGRTIYDAVKKTKKFISLSIKYTPEIGQGRGPISGVYLMLNEINFLVFFTAS